MAMLKAQTCSYPEKQKLVVEHSHLHYEDMSNRDNEIKYSTYKVLLPFLNDVERDLDQVLQVTSLKNERRWLELVVKKSRRRERTRDRRTRN
jgi:hypothetical protein